MPSQFNEDEILLELFPPNTHGTYVDVGCGPPIDQSNTYELYRRGWKGLCIDPQYDYIKQHQQLRVHDITLQAAASNNFGIILLYDCGMMATVEKGLKRNYEKKQWVVEAPLSDILSHFPEIRDNCRFCNIDVEQHEQQVLEGIDWTTFKPEIFCIEAFGDRSWEKILFDNGYRYFRSTQGINRFYELF